MFTDPTRIRANDPGHVEGNPVFMYHDAFNPNVDEIADLKKRYTAGDVGDVEVKERLFSSLEKILEPMRARRAYYEAHMDEVHDILKSGTKKIREEADVTLEKVRDAMKLYKI